MLRKRRHGKEVTHWSPQSRLVARLAKETGMTKSEICEQLQREWRQRQQNKPDTLNF